MGLLKYICILCVWVHVSLFKFLWYYSQAKCSIYLLKREKKSILCFFSTNGCMEGYDTNQRGTKSGPNGEQKYNLYLCKAKKNAFSYLLFFFPSLVCCVLTLCLCSFCAYICDLNISCRGLICWQVSSHKYKRKKSNFNLYNPLSSIVYHSGKW